MNGLELSGYLVSNLMGNDGTSEEGGVISSHCWRSMNSLLTQV